MNDISGSKCSDEGEIGRARRRQSALGLSQRMTEQNEAISELAIASCSRMSLPHLSFTFTLLASKVAILYASSL